MDRRKNEQLPFAIEGEFMLSLAQLSCCSSPSRNPPQACIFLCLLFYFYLNCACMLLEDN